VTAGITLSGSMAFNGSTGTVVKDVGTYTQAVGTLTLSSTGNNYSMSFSNPTPNNYVVTPVTLTVTAWSHTVAYGDSVPTITANIVGFVNSETATVIDTPPTCS